MHCFAFTGWYDSPTNLRWWRICSLMCLTTRSIWNSFREPNAGLFNTKHIFINVYIYFSQECMCWSKSHPHPSFMQSIYALAASPEEQNERKKSQALFASWNCLPTLWNFLSICSSSLPWLKLHPALLKRRLLSRSFKPKLCFKKERNSLTFRPFHMKTPPPTFLLALLVLMQY